jgi:hypothetical protein
MFAEAKKVRGRTTKLYSIAEAALQRPDDTVGRVVFPAVGEGTLRAPVAEAKTYRARVRTVLTYYRRMPPKLPAAIEFKCNNTAYRPVMDALALFARYAEVPNKVRTCSFLDAAHQDQGPTRSRPRSVPADDAALQPRRLRAAPAAACSTAWGRSASREPVPPWVKRAGYTRQAG